MSIGCLAGRVLLATGLVSLVLFWDLVLPWARERLRQWRGEPADVAETSPESTGPAAETPASDFVSAAGAKTEELVTRQEQNGRAASPAEEKPVAGTEAQKAWQAARELPHQFIPDWKHDEDYLKLLHEAAVGGSEEAMNKLADYAFRRKAFVESYYWKLKLNMCSGRINDIGTTEILAAWVASGCPTQYRNVMRGFSEEQGMFARAVMRVKAGIDVSNANRRLKLLAKAGNADAQQYLRSGKKKIT